MAENLLAKLEQIEARDGQPTSDHAAAATASSPGIAARSSEGANGMGMSGIVTRRAGSGPDDSAASATTSAA
jgi:hypothetical protein